MLKLPATSHHLCPNWRWCYCKRLLSRWLRAGLFLHQPIGFLVVRLSPCRKCPNTQKMAVDCPLVITSIAETLFQSSVRNLIKTWIVRDKHCQWSIRVCTVHLHKSKIINSHSSSHYYWILWSKHYIKVPLVSRRACNYVRSNELWKWRHRSHHFPIIGFIFRQCVFPILCNYCPMIWCLHTTAQLVEQARIENIEFRHLSSVSTQIVSGKQKPIQKLFQESCWIFHSETLFALKWKGDTWWFC